MLDGDATRLGGKPVSVACADDDRIDSAQNRVDAVEALDFFVRFLARRDVANKAGKHRLRCRSNRRNGQLERKRGAVGANRFKLEPFAEDGAFARSEVVGEASTMR